MVCESALCEAYGAESGSMPGTSLLDLSRYASDHAQTLTGYSHNDSDSPLRGFEASQKRNFVNRDSGEIKLERIILGLDSIRDLMLNNTKVQFIPFLMRRIDCDTCHDAYSTSEAETRATIQVNQ